MRRKVLVPAPGVKAFGKDGGEVDLEALRGRVIKKTRPKPDGAIIAIIDQGDGVEGIPIRFQSGADYERCRQEE